MFSPELYKELKNAKEGSVGKLVKIPAGKYIADISGTNLGNSLFPHLKLVKTNIAKQKWQNFLKNNQNFCCC